ncbi:MAG TPA: patatin-like phospholipase family protein [Acidimicrobiales bacterium]|nr:patatin-like phospholipase family protein [Acidimicrobiales bacterium]
METTKALVLGGGGVTGIAWELGVIASLAGEGIDLTDADLIVGTSAGAAVAAQITSASLDELVGAQLAESQELAAELDLDLLAEIFWLLSEGPGADDDRRAQVGALALGARTVAEPVRRAVIAARLPSHQWPSHPVVVTAVDADSGALCTFDAFSGVSLVDAVAASCAVPGVWPPVSVGGRRYIDGGVRSVTNADLASGCGRVLVLAPVPATLTPGLEREVDGLRGQGSTVMMVSADDAALAGFGDNLLDPSRRGPALEEGRRQGVAAVGAIRELWAG